MELSLPCFLVEKMFANFLYGKLFQKNGSFLNVFETSFFESPLCFSLCAQKDLDIFFLFSPSPSTNSHFSFSVLSFSLFLDVLFNYSCLQEKTKKCFSLSISQARNFSLKKKKSLLFSEKLCFHPFFLHSFFFKDKCFRFLFQHLILSPFFEHCPFVISPPSFFYRLTFMSLEDAGVDAPSRK